MSLDTFANLKQSVADHLDRDDLTNYIPDFITLAESRHKRHPSRGGVRIKEMISRSALTVDARQVSLPTGFLEAINLRLLTNPVTVMTYVNYHEMARLRDETSGKPEYFTVSSEIEFDHTPDSSYSGEIIYYKSETALSDSNTSNNILAQVPDVYLYGALLASAPFLMEDPRINVWATLYKEAAESANAQTNQGRLVGPLVSRPRGDTP